MCLYIKFLLLWLIKGSWSLNIRQISAVGWRGISSTSLGGSTEFIRSNDEVFLEVLETYKSLYGDLRVKNSFVVPSGDSRWPRESWGLPLGSRVADIRRSKHARDASVYEPTSFRCHLDDLGFVWDPPVTSTHSFYRFLEALMIYRRHNNGSSLVPGTYKVDVTMCPWWPQDFDGYRLGWHAAQYRILGRKHNALSLDEVEELDRLGFVWDLKQYKFDTFCALLDMYHQKQGKREQPPIHWRVPADADAADAAGWPAEHSGYRLGLRTNSALRGLIFTDPEQRALLLEKYGPLFREREDLLCFSEGAVMSKPKTVSQRKHQRRSATHFEVLIAALTAFRERYGTANVPHAGLLVVEGPDGNIDVYDALKKWRRRTADGTLQALQMETLRSIGVELDGGIVQEGAFRAALAHFNETQGNTDIPERFVVPFMASENGSGVVRRGGQDDDHDHRHDNDDDEDDCSYPISTRGMKLGALVKRLRTGTWTPSAATLDWLSRRGFRWTNARRRSFDLVCVALLTHHQLFGDMLVPRYFVVPDEEPWPKDVHGMQLGNRVRNIRAGTAYQRREQLNRLREIGFFDSDPGSGPIM